jgi:hypothetical protein
MGESVETARGSGTEEVREADERGGRIEAGNRKEEER